MVSRKEIQYRREFPLAPIRHMDVMDKLARCQFCDRLCCCLEHLAEHENRHLPTKGRKETLNEESKYSSELSGWVEATEHVLRSRKKINFPLFCIYCKITVRNEHELRHLMTGGPRCSVKECHWIISFKKYFEKSRDRKIALVLEETERKTVDRAASFVSANNSVNNQLTRPHITPREDSSRSLGRMKPISTSTPQDGCEPSSTLEKDFSSAAVEQTPVGAKTLNAPHSILAVKNDQKPKGESVRKVTFSCIVETTNNSSTEASSSNQEGNEKELHDMIQTEKKLEENEDFFAEKQYKQEEENEKNNTFKKEGDDRQFLSKNAVQNICDDKFEVENKTNLVLIGNKKQSKSIDGMELIDSSNKAGKEEVKGEEINDEEWKLEKSDWHGRLEVPKNPEVNNEDRSRDKIIESSEKEEKEMLITSDRGEIYLQNSSSDEFGESSSNLNFFSGEESRNETCMFENESSGSNDSYCKTFREGNSWSKLHEAECQAFQDSENLQSNAFSTGQKFAKTSRLLEKVDDDEGSESQFTENELQLDARESGEEVSSHDEDDDDDDDDGDDDDDDDDGDGGEGNDKATNFPHSDGNVSSNEHGNESNIEEEWGFTKLKTALSYSWGKAKELVMQPWGVKRENTEKEENNENSAKRIKMSHSCSRSDPNPNSFPVQWKWSHRSVRSSEYLNISKRRPLTRMMKK